ncbi:MAG: hypothetical protein ACYTXI_36770 [Nostoc sp.]
MLPKIPPKNSIKNLLTKILPVKNNDDIDRGLGLGWWLRKELLDTNEITVCRYLLDIWCLGVKDTIPPRTVDKIKFKEFTESLFEPFPGKPHLVSLENLPRDNIMLANMQKA